jgi:hypothetical protein
LLSLVAAAASPAATSLEALDADEDAESRSAWMLASDEADPDESDAVGLGLAVGATVGTVTAAGSAAAPNREHPASEAPTRATAAAVTPIRAARVRATDEIT